MDTATSPPTPVPPPLPPSPPLQAFDTLWDFQHPAETEAAFRALLPEAEAATDDPSLHWQLLTQIARAQGLQRRFEDAHATLDRVEKALETADPTAPSTAVARVRFLLERGRAFNSAQRKDDARPLFLQAWETAQQADSEGTRTLRMDHFAVDAAHMLGIVEPPCEALQWNLRALELAEQSADESAKKWLGSLYNNIGWTLHDRGEYERALEVFEKALAWRETQNQPDPLHVAKWCVARTLRSLGRIDEALARQEKLLAECEAAGKLDGFVLEELAECHLAQNRTETAIEFFARAYDELSADPWFVQNEPARLARIHQLAFGRQDS